MGWLTVFAGVVAARALADQRAGGHHLRPGVAGVPHAVQRRCERLRPAGPDVAAARCGHDAGVQWRYRTRAPVDQSEGALHAVGDGLVLSADRRAVRTGVHCRCDVHADSVAVGTHGWGGEQPGGPEVSE